MNCKLILPNIAVVAVCFIACKKTDNPGVNPGPGPTIPNFDPALTTGTLKSTANFPVGIAIGYDLFKNNTAYANVVKMEFDNITFEYQMKHSAIVKTNGSKDYSKTDELVNLVAAGGQQIFGHALAWYQSNNGDFLRSFASIPASGAPDLFAGQNGDFESGTATSFAPHWARLQNVPAVATYDVETTAPPQGSRAFKVTVITPGANPYDAQMIQNNGTSNFWPGVMGTQYIIKLWAKTDAAGSNSFRVINQVGSSPTLTPNYDLFPTTTWAEYSIPFTCAESNPTFKFWFNKTGTYWIDDIRIFEATPAPPGNAIVAAKMDSVLKDWVQGMVNRYKDKVHAWDAINEPYTDGSPVFRTGTSTGEIYYWAQYLGRGYVAKVFNYAHQADATCDLFLNDYNLESNFAKLDSIIALANELKAQGIPITGIGTQMHININTSQAGIDNMFIKLAATGLKIRISELDIRINPSDAIGFTATPTLLDNQAALYKSVLASYIKNVPAPQRFGATVWNVGDSDSWIVVGGKQDFPTLFNSSYQKKRAYAGFWQGVKQ
jgi:endo-1,4-beta-xylanase